jgi:hypothetical protein
MPPQKNAIPFVSQYNVYRISWIFMIRFCANFGYYGTVLMSSEVFRQETDVCTAWAFDVWPNLFPRCHPVLVTVACAVRSLLDYFRSKRTEFVSFWNELSCGSACRHMTRSDYNEMLFTSLSEVLGRHLLRLFSFAICVIDNHILYCVTAH